MKKANDIVRAVVYVSRGDLRQMQSLLALTGTSFSQWVRETMRGLIGERDETTKRKGKT